MGLILFCVGLGTLLYAFVFLPWKVKTCQSWPQVEGEIVSAELTRSGMGQPGQANTVFGADIAYSYRVQGRPLKAHKVKPGGQLELSIPGFAEKKLKHYTVGQSVAVYYNPKQPKEAYIEINEEVSAFYGAIGLFFCVVSFIF